MIEQDNSNTAENERCGERNKVAESEAGDRMSRIVGALTFMLPGVDEETIEAAEGGEEERNR